MRTFFFVAMSFVLLTLPMVAIGAPSVDELKENVARLWQPLHKKQPQVTAQELKKIIDAGEKIYLVDIRSEAEYQAGHLPNAIHLKRGLRSNSPIPNVRSTFTAGLQPEEHLQSSVSVKLATQMFSTFQMHSKGGWSLVSPFITATVNLF